MESIRPFFSWLTWFKKKGSPFACPDRSPSDSGDSPSDSNLREARAPMCVFFGGGRSGGREYRGNQKKKQVVSLGFTKRNVFDYPFLP